MQRPPAGRSEATEVLPFWRRLVWFVALWLAGVAVLGSVALLIRVALRM